MLLGSKLEDVKCALETSEATFRSYGAMCSQEGAVFCGFLYYLAYPMICTSTNIPNLKRSCPPELTKITHAPSLQQLE